MCGLTVILFKHVVLCRKQPAQLLMSGHDINLKNHCVQIQYETTSHYRDQDPQLHGNCTDRHESQYTLFGVYYTMYTMQWRIKSSLPPIQRYEFKKSTKALMYKGLPWRLQFLSWIRVGGWEMHIHNSAPWLEKNWIPTPKKNNLNFLQPGGSTIFRFNTL